MSPALRCDSKKADQIDRLLFVARTGIEPELRVMRPALRRDKKQKSQSNMIGFLS
jgi:hypothetical protein